MKKLFFLILLSISIRSFAQVGWVPIYSKERHIGLMADSLFYGPLKDTNYTPQRHGALTFRTADKSWYMSIDTIAGVKRWMKVSAGSDFDLTQSGIDYNSTLSLAKDSQVLSGVTYSGGLYSASSGSIIFTGRYASTASNEWEQSITFSPTTSASGIVGIGLKENSFLGSGNAEVYVDMSNNLIGTINGGSQWNSTLSIPAVQVNDVIVLKFSFYHNHLIFSYQNKTRGVTKSIDLLKRFGDVSGFLSYGGHAGGNPCIWAASISGIKIYDWKFTDNGSGKVVWIGQSISEGYAATAYDSSYVGRLNNASYWKINNYSKAGQSSKDLVNNLTIEGAFLSHPSVVVIDGIWYNDFFLSETSAATIARLKTIREKIAAYNPSMPVIWLGTPPNGGLLTFSNTIIDTMKYYYPNDTYFKLSDYLSGSWASTDGAHLANLGHKQIYDSLSIRLPFIIGRKPNLVYDDGSKVGVGTSAPDSMLTVNQGAHFLRGIKAENLASFGDTTNFKPIVVNTTGTGGTFGTIYKATYWPGSVGGGGGANTALSNLASVSINTSLIPQSAKDLGAAATPFKDLYLYGSGSFGSHSMKFTGTPTGNRVYTFPDATTTIVATDQTQTLSNKRWVPRVGSTTSSATPTINTDNYDIYKLTAQAADITSFTTNLSGSPNDGDVLEIQITGTAARAITWGSSFVSSSVTLPTTTTSTSTLTVVFQYYTTSSYGNNKWVCANFY